MVKKETKEKAETSVSKTNKENKVSKKKIEEKPQTQSLGKSKKKLIAIIASVVAVIAVAVCSVVIYLVNRDTRENSTVHAVVDNREFYVGEKLEDIEISLSSGDTEGTISWVTPNKTLSLGKNVCEWLFVPKDEEAFKNASGTISISAVEEKANPNINVVVETEVIYAETLLSSVEISLSEGDTEGTLEWVDGSTILLEGENEYKYKFTPTNADEYKQVCGKIKLTAIAQSISTIEIATNQTKTEYVAFEQFDDTGLTLTAVYDGGKVETIESGWEVSYNSQNSLKVSDTSVKITYAGKICYASVSVSKKVIAKPAVQGTYVYTGLSLTAVLVEDENSELYTVSNNTYSVAGNHSVTVTLIDTDNYAWQGETTQATTIPFVINKAELVVQRNNYSGVYDGTAHSASVSSQSSVVYYSTQELTSSTYESASTTPIEFVDATETKVYFYIVGDANHNDMSSFVTVSIAKANPFVETEYCYSVVGEKNVSVPVSYVSVKGINNSALDATGLIEFEYYTAYTDENVNTKTTTANGATTEGGAPSVAGSYVVKTIYVGSKNYASATTLSMFLVDTDDCAMLAHDEDRAFAWRYASITGADIYSYLEVKKQENGTIYELVATMIFGSELSPITDSSESKTGKIIKKDGVYQMFINENVFVLNIEETADSATVTLVDEEGNDYQTLTKWDIPYYIGTYQLVTATLEEVDYTSELYVYIHNGVVYFTYTGYYISGSNLKTVSYSGTVIYYSSGTLSFNDGTEKVINVSGYSDDLEPETLKLTITKLPSTYSVSGNYEKVA